MNNAPVLSITTRLATATFALVATLAVVQGVDSMSSHYAKATMAQVASNQVSKTHQA